MSTDSNLERLKEKVEPAYHKLDKVFCPYLQKQVSFNKKGLNHLKFKRDKEARNRDDQYIRLKHLNFAPRVVEKSATLQEHRRQKEFVQIRTNSRNERIQKWVVYYGFVAIIVDSGQQKRLKIIIKQVEDGEPYFWSIVPFWKKNKELVLASGDMATD